MSWDACPDAPAPTSRASVPATCAPRARGAALSECHRVLVARVDHAVADSERAVLAAGRSIEEIVTEAERHVGDLAQLRVALDGDGAPHDGLAGRIAQQNATARGFSDCVVAGVSEQGDDTARALTLTEGIGRCAVEIARISSEARLLTVSVRIEAARLGPLGRSVAVIAGQIRDVSLAIEGANRMISELVTALSEVLPPVVEHSRRMQGQSDRYREALEDQSRAIERGVEALRGTMLGSLAEGHARTAQVVSMGQEAMSALQFQDPMCKSLRDMIAAVEAVGARHDIALDNTTAPAETREPRADEGAPARGDVVLF